MSANKSILVLSYNICFQAMTHDASGSAYDLGKSCIWSEKAGLTICAQNMAEFLDGVPSSSGHQNFDFVGIQEANNVANLQIAATKSLARLQMIFSKSHATNHAHPMQMASFYDDTKYTLVDHVCSQFSSKNTDRPFHILLLNNSSTQEKVIFINCHAPHGSNRNQQHPDYKYSSYEAVSYDLSHAVKTMTSFDPSDSYKIIMTGDFNELEWDFRADDIRSKVWKPLQYAGCDIEAKIDNVVFSCSESNGYWTGETGQRGGDYIFSSGNAAKILVPSNYTFAPAGIFNKTEKERIKLMKSIWQSDHLPVMTQLN